jgi:hypothetical protein
MIKPLIAAGLTLAMTTSAMAQTATTSPLALRAAIISTLAAQLAHDDEELARLQQQRAEGMYLKGQTSPLAGAPPAKSALPMVVDTPIHKPGARIPPVGATPTMPTVASPP